MVAQKKWNSIPELPRGHFYPLLKQQLECQAGPLQCNAGRHDNNYCTFATSAASKCIDLFA